MQHQTLGELPDLIVRGLRAALTTPHTTHETDVLAALRARTPAQHHAELQEAFDDVRRIYGVRDDDAGILLWRMGIARRAVLEAGKRLVARGALHDASHVIDATGDEIVGLLRGATTPSANAVAARVAKRAELDALSPPVMLGEEGPRPALDCFPSAVARMMRGVDMFMHAFEGEREPDPTGVRGTGVSAGVYEGRARVVRDAADFHRIEAGDVLVARFTSPAYNVLLPMLGAIVTERGGLLSHAAIVAREYGIPAVVDTRNALERIADGALVRVDGTTGVVDVIGTAATTSAPKHAAVAPVERLRVVPVTAGRVVALRDADGAAFGGKAKALAAAIAAKLPVPDGVALDADLVERVVNGEADAREQVREACARLRGPWAVRSSAIGEDSAGASFAGQHATILGVKPDELFDAIDKVHASGHTASALAYRARMKIDGTARMGVVIQTLLRPDISGVLFSKDPTKSARDGRLIEATWGLGEALVSGLVTPDRYRVASDGKVIERAIGDKDLAIEARDGGGTEEVAIEAERAKSACLDDARLAELSQLANRCEQLFGGPQDLEWAVANGQLHLLQSRPVTTA
jgi:pyruvate,water dikinase